MRCKYCGLEMFIDHAEYEVTGDNSPDTKTEVRHVPYFCCTDYDCKGYGQQVKGTGARLI